jgi:hypothetical protein
VRPAGPGAIAAGGGLGGSATGSGSSTPDVKKTGFEPEPEVHIKATGLDNMLEALEIVNAKGDKANIGAQAGLIEKHPEVSVLLAYGTDLLGTGADLFFPLSSFFPHNDPLNHIATFQSGLRSLPRERNAGTQEIPPWASKAADARYALQAVPEGSRESVSPLGPQFAPLVSRLLQRGVIDSRHTLTCLQIQPSLSGLQRYQGREGLCAQRVSGGEGTSICRVACYVT